MSYKEIKEDLKDWRSMIARYQKADHKKALIQILNSKLPYIGLWVLMYFTYSYSIILTLLLAVVNAFFLVRIFIIQHDCGHYSFFNSKKLNDFVGTVCSYFSTIPFKYWARTHAFHHAHTGMLEYRDIGDIDTLTVEEYRKKSKFGRFMYRVFRSPIVMFVIVPFYYFTVSMRFPTISLKSISSMNWAQLRNNLGIAAVYVGLGYLLGWQRFLVVQFSIVFVFMIIAFWFFYIQHQHERTYKEWKSNWNSLVASVQGATFYKLPKLWTWLTGYIGYHHIHHLSSKIPNYNLVKCADENPILMKHVETVSFTESLKMIFNKLWDEENQRMISFSDFNRMERMRMAA